MSEQEVKSFSPTFFDVRTSTYSPNLEVGLTEEGYKLYIERESDESGVALDIDKETFKALERTFILVEIDED